MKIKIILVVLAVIAVLLVLAVVVVGSHLGGIVKAGMETVGPKVTQTTLTVEDVTVSLLGGSAGVKNLVLGNPEGYKTPQALSLSNAVVSLVPGSVLSSKIVIRSVEVRGLEVTFEGSPFGSNNLSQLLANVQSFAGTAQPATNAPAPAAPAASAKPGKKLQVDNFLITGAKIHVNLSLLGGRQFTLPLPEIQLTALGQGPEGITATDLTQKVLGEITSGTLQAVAQSVKDLTKNVTDAAKNTAQDLLKGGGNATDKVKQGLKGLFGK